jgi:uncharacterized BrkB/YihY/UPF0761 family membrane protein
VAAGVVFYDLLALFPAITALVSLYGVFAKGSTINEHLSIISGFLPGGAMDIVQEQVNRLVSKGAAKLGVGFIVGLLVALWSANAGMKAIMDALNVVYDEKEKRGFIKLNLVSLAFTIAALAAVLLAISPSWSCPLFSTLSVWQYTPRQPRSWASVRTSGRHWPTRKPASITLGRAVARAGGTQIRAQFSRQSCPPPQRESAPTPCCRAQGQGEIRSAPGP